MEQQQQKKLKLEEKRVQRLSGVIKYPNAASFASGNKQKQQRITALQLWNVHDKTTNQ